MTGQSFKSFLVLFIITLIAWFFLLGLWIYYFITNYLIFKRVGERLSPQLIENPSNLFPLVMGLILLVVIFIAIIAFFSDLYRKKSLSDTYDNFIANITHELKSPISSVQLITETLLQRKVPHEKQKEFLFQIRSDLKRLEKNVNAILFLSDFQNRKFIRHYPSEYRIFQADQLFRELIKESSEELNIFERITITGEAPYLCVADRHWMKIVIDNLLDNARKYGPEDLHLQIRLHTDSSYVIIEIEDNGIGIPEKYQKKIFDKFFRLQLPDSPSVKGSGLGLYWVKSIVRYHGGKIEVKSEGLYKGTTFIIRLPIYRKKRKRYLNKLLTRSGLIKEKEEVKHE